MTFTIQVMKRNIIFKAFSSSGSSILVFKDRYFQWYKMIVIEFIKRSRERETSQVCDVEVEPGWSCIFCYSSEESQLGMQRFSLWQGFIVGWLWLTRNSRDQLQRSQHSDGPQSLQIYNLLLLGLPGPPRLPVVGRQDGDVPADV